MSVRMSLVSISKVVDYEYSPLILRDSRANETQARVKVTSREKGETRRGERRMRDCSYSTKVVVSRIEGGYIAVNTDFTIVEFVVDFVTVSAPTHLHFSLSPFHVLCRCFKAMSFVAI